MLPLSYPFVSPVWDWNSNFLVYSQEAIRNSLLTGRLFLMGLLQEDFPALSRPLSFSQWPLYNGAPSSAQPICKAVP